MFENIGTFFKRIMKTEPKQLASKDAAKERLHLVLMQDRANVSVDFLELMKQEIIEVIKKYIDIDEKSIDVRLTNQANDDGTTGAPALYANIPILNIKNESKSEIIQKEETIDEEPKEIVELEQQSEKALENMEQSKSKEEKDLEETNDTEIKVEDEDNKNESKEEAEIIKEETQDVKENEEEVDDVPTFDELLKQSEEENNTQEEKKEESPKKENKPKNQNNKSKNKKKN